MIETLYTVFLGLIFIISIPPNIVSLYTPFPNTFEFYLFSRKEGYNKIDSLEYTIIYFLIFPALFEEYYYYQKEVANHKLNEFIDQ